MRFQFHSISSAIIRNTSKQMMKDIDKIIIFGQKTFKQTNVHNIQKKMDKITYSTFYNQFASHEWENEWKKKGAHTGPWPTDKLKLYTIRLRRLVLMKCYIWLEKEKDSFFAKIEARKKK